MDVLTHILLGILLGAIAGGDYWWWILFSIAPDIPQIFLYLLLGYRNKRKFLFPKAIDWDEFSNSKWSALFFLPHTVYAWALASLIFGPIASIAYGVHLLVDWPSHTGEWELRPFYPASQSLPGLFDGWKR